MSGTTKPHRGYTGSIEVSNDDKILYGRILFISDLITYDGITVEEIQKDFEEAVDNYLMNCKETGKTPNKPFSGTFNIRIGADRHKRLAVYAQKNDKSINEAVVESIDSFLKQENRSISQGTFNKLFSVRNKTLLQREETKIVGESSESSHMFEQGRYNLFCESRILTTVKQEKVIPHARTIQ